MGERRALSQKVPDPSAQQRAQWPHIALLQSQARKNESLEAWWGRDRLFLGIWEARMSKPENFETQDHTVPGITHDFSRLTSPFLPVHLKSVPYLSSCSFSWAVHTPH